MNLVPKAKEAVMTEKPICPNCQEEGKEVPLRRLRYVLYPGPKWWGCPDCNKVFKQIEPLGEDPLEQVNWTYRELRERQRQRQSR